MKNFDKNNLGRMKLVDFKVLRREAKERAHGTKKFMHRKHSAHAVLIDQEDVLQKQHREFSHVKWTECTTECDYHEVVSVTRQLETPNASTRNSLKPVIVYPSLTCITKGERNSTIV